MRLWRETKQECIRRLEARLSDVRNNRDYWAGKYEREVTRADRYADALKDERDYSDNLTLLVEPVIDLIESRKGPV